MNITHDFKNVLLNRREISIVIDSASNPGFDKTASVISEHFNVSKDVLAIKSLKGNFGNNSFLVNAFIYDSVENKNRIEPKIKVKEKK